MLTFTLEVFDCKTKTVQLYEYDDSVLVQIKQKQHIFWDDERLATSAVENSNKKAI